MVKKSLVIRLGLWLLVSLVCCGLGNTRLRATEGEALEVTFHYKLVSSSPAHDGLVGQGPELLEPETFKGATISHQAPAIAGYRLVGQARYQQSTTDLLEVNTETVQLDQIDYGYVRGLGYVLQADLATPNHKWSYDFAYVKVEAKELSSQSEGEQAQGPSSSQTAYSLQSASTSSAVSDGHPLSQSSLSASSPSSSPSSKSVASQSIQALQGTTSASSSSQSQSSSTSQASHPIYRLYNRNSGEHFYTSSNEERQILYDTHGWGKEGIAWFAPTQGQAVYRLYNPNAGDHHYTISSHERDHLVKVGWRYEGVISQSGGTVPIYRLYNPNAKQAGAHHYTTSSGERDHLKKLGWRDEGIGWYAVKVGYGPAQTEFHPRFNKRIALTFDDGPRAATTPKVLDILARYQVKATFFVVGQSISGNEAILRRTANSGHQIANHTWSHPVLPYLSTPAISAQISQTSAKIASVIGSHPTIFRAPYGEVNARVISGAKLPAIGWSLDTWDWKNRNTAAIMTEVRKAKDGDIILMHDIHQTTVDALPSVLAYLKAQGYEFVTVSELLGNNLSYRVYHRR